MNSEEMLNNIKTDLAGLDLDTLREILPNKQKLTIKTESGVIREEVSCFFQVIEDGSKTVFKDKNLDIVIQNSELLGHRLEPSDYKEKLIRTLTKLKRDQRDDIRCKGERK